VLETRSPGDGIRVLAWSDLEDEGFVVAFTERHAGASEGPFASLNLSAAVGDLAERVNANRAAVCRSLGIEAFVVPGQIHGSGVAHVGAVTARAGFDDPSTALWGVDALTTSRRGVAVAVLVADCVPVALASPAEGRVTAIHAGWRGIAAGVVQAGLSTFGRPAGVHAAIGPSVGPDHYEVGEEVAEAVAAAAEGGVAARRTGHRLLLDLPATVEAILSARGVGRVERAGECTACRPDRYFSHRRDGPTGRQAMIAFRR